MLGKYLIFLIIVSFDYLKIQSERTFGFNYSNNLKKIVGFHERIRPKKKKKGYLGELFDIFEKNLRIMVIHKLNLMFHF